LETAGTAARRAQAIVGRSPALREVLHLVDLVAGTDATVLISGETGTGKELVARAIHEQSTRRNGPLVSVNLAAIPASLIASELFGHEKGAFTGALQRRLGRFEMAEGGTLFLDEVGELPPEAQVALLRVLQEGEIERVGSGRPIRTNVRVVAATHRNLEEEVAAGRFRADLYYRLNVVPVAIPPLRDRTEDIPLLVRHFVDRSARNCGKTIRNVDDGTMRLLQSHSWPGNVRELQNIVERAVIFAEADTMTVDERWLQRPAASAALAATSDVAAATVIQGLAAHRVAQEKAMIEKALAESRGTVSGPFGAAARLQLPSSTLESKIRTLRIDKNCFRRLQVVEN
jgi:formate hydrogenlyase transcriptional activator